MSGGRWWSASTDLEGRPEDVIKEGEGPYNAFAARLAERGYITYAPQNPYIGYHEFRTLQRKANPLGWTLFTFAIAQHQQQLALALIAAVRRSRPHRLLRPLVRRQGGHAQSPRC